MKALGLPFGGSPTADLNTTAAFALCVFFGIQFLAIRKSGIKAYGHLFQPFWWLFPINVIEEIARPVVLAMRLAFNIFAGELLLFVVATLIISNIVIGPVNVSVAAAFVPFGIEFFNFFDRDDPSVRLHPPHHRVSLLGDCRGTLVGSQTRPRKVHRDS